MKKESLLNFEEALNALYSSTHSLERYEIIPLWQSQGRILASDVLCQKSLPAFNNSAMDGYAVRLDDSGKILSIQGTIFAGDKPPFELLKNGYCYKIMTGAIVPSDVEVIVPFEQAILLENGTVQLPQKLKKDAHIRYAGEESQCGEVLLKKGTCLTSSMIGLLGSQGISYIHVAQKLKVAILSSGNEVIEPWEANDTTRIFNANASALMALCYEMGCEPHYIKLVNDTLSSAIQSINELRHYDIIITTGGVSVGEADFMDKAFLANGLSVIFHKVGLKPGKATLFGFLGKTAVLALPGNPLSAIVNFYLFARPLIAKLLGDMKCYPSYVIAKNTTTFSISPSRANVILGVLQDGKFTVFNGNHYGSGMIKPIVESNAFVMTGIGVDKLHAGDKIKVIPLDFPMSETILELIN